MKVLKIQIAYDDRHVTDETPVSEIDSGYYFHFLEYVTDENGRKGAKFVADGSSGYDFHYEAEEFTLFPGDVYRGSWSYTDIVGPSEWDEVMNCYEVKLVEVEE